MRELMLTVRELLEVALQECKAKPNAGRVDTVLNLKVPVGLRTKELLDAAEIGKLRLRWNGPFTVTASQRARAPRHTLLHSLRR